MPPGDPLRGRRPQTRAREHSVSYTRGRDGAATRYRANIGGDPIAGNLRFAESKWGCYVLTRLGGSVGDATSLEYGQAQLEACWQTRNGAG